MGGGLKGEGPSDAVMAMLLRLVQPSDGLDPAERLRDLLAEAQADPIAWMACRAAIDRRTSAGGVLRHMRGHSHRAQFVDEVSRVVSLVGSERDRMRPVGSGLDHVQRRYPLGISAGLGQAGIDKQAMTVLHQAVPQGA